MDPVCYCYVPKVLHILAFYLLSCRHDTAETIERCLEKGIQVKMVTGDQQLIGKETARQLGMGTNIHKIEVLLHAKGGTGLVGGHANVDELVEQADGFAEVFPEHKFEIVKILQVCAVCQLY